MNLTTKIKKKIINFRTNNYYLKNINSVEYFNTSSRRWVDMGQDKPIETINKALDTINEALVFE